MKYCSFIIFLFCFTKVTFADPKPQPGFVQQIWDTLKFSSSTPYNDTASNCISEMKNNISEIFKEMKDTIKENTEIFLIHLPLLFNKDFDNITQCSSKCPFNICDDNQTSSLIQSSINNLQSFSKLSLFCTKLSLLQSGVHLATDNICKDAPKFDKIFERAQNMSEEYVNNTIRGWICTFNRFFDNQLVQSVDFTGLTKNLTDPNIKTNIMDAAAKIDRCMFKLILDVNTTQTAKENCTGPIYNLIKDINNNLNSFLSIRSSSSSQDNDILNAIKTHLNQMLSSIDSIFIARDTYINDTKNTTTLASKSFSDILLHYFDGVISPIQSLDFIKSKNSTLNNIVTSAGECLKCTINAYIDLVKVGLNWSGLILDAKRAAFCSAVTFIDKIQNYTCKTYNSTNDIVNAAGSNLTLQTDQFEKNIFCYQKEFNFSFITNILGSLLNLFTSTIGIIMNNISNVISTLTNITKTTATNTTCLLTDVLNKFDMKCTNGSTLIEPLFNQLIKDVNTCKVDKFVVPNFCEKGYFSFSLWNLKNIIQFHSGIFNNISEQLLQLGSNFEECVQSKYQNAVPKLDLALSIC